MLPAPVVLALREITLRDAPRNIAKKPSFVIRCGDFEYSSAGLLGALGAPERHAPGLVRLPLPDALVADEVHVTFYKRTRLGKRKRAFSFWFHTAFTGLRLSLSKAELDKAHNPYDEPPNITAEGHRRDGVWRRPQTDTIRWRKGICVMQYICLFLILFYGVINKCN